MLTGEKKWFSLIILELFSPHENLSKVGNPCSGVGKISDAPLEPENINGLVNLHHLSHEDSSFLGGRGALGP